ncbi:MAG: hypothetical protein IPL87_02060 [Candidatus Moraniibacteriota bacterium]|nr:MAG: hypothetical protein IPL87_02060 [Candidatus Moranbacteria bacterium]
MTDTFTPDPPVDEERNQKIQSLREMIATAERTMQSAKAMLLQLEGKKRVGRPRKVEDIEDGTVIQGTFDGQVMQGSDGKQYPVPANYASKSKLVEGDVLKLTITPDGSFIYKQIGPADRRHAIGVVAQDEQGNYLILADGRPYRVLLASITYFKANPGDEVAIVCSREGNATWAAIENILQPGGNTEKIGFSNPLAAFPSSNRAPREEKKDESLSSAPAEDILSEWEKDFAELKESASSKESSHPAE